MKASTRVKYGSAEVLTVKEVTTPTPSDNELLIRVFATTVNRTDCAILTAQPFIMRAFIGLFKPKHAITGTDFAGQIEAIGKNVTSFKVGDRVMGFDDMGLKSNAYYMTLAQDKPLVTIPSNFTYEEAAGSLEGVHYAINFINKVTLKAGQKVLVNGGTGAIGSVVLQLCKYYNTEVTVVCEGTHKALLEALGADKIIDYTTEDFTKSVEKYDFVFDAVGKSTFGKCKPILKEKGIYISSELGPMIQNPFLALITPLLGGKKVIFPVPIDIKASLVFIKELIEKGQFKPLIDRRYPLEKIAEAYSFVATGAKVGNVIITMED